MPTPDRDDRESEEPAPARGTPLFLSGGGASAPAPRPPRRSYHCPHCGGALDLHGLGPAPDAVVVDASGPSNRRPVPPALARWLGDWLAHGFPIGHAFSTPREAAAVSASAGESQRPSWWRQGLRLLLILGGLGVIGVAITNPIPQRAPEAPRPAAPAARPPMPWSGPEAMLLGVIAQYNAAEAQVAATLSLDPLRPVLDPAGPLLQRRAAALAARQARGAAHTTRLLRWAVGSITITGTTALVTTQETWANQEIGAVAAAQATVRVTYTLRLDATTRRWLIVDARQRFLGATDGQPLPSGTLRRCLPASSSACPSTSAGLGEATPNGRR